MHKIKKNGLNNYVSIDLEIHPENNELLKIGAIDPENNKIPII